MFAGGGVGNGEVGSAVAGFYEVVVNALDGRDGFIGIEFNGGDIVVKDGKEFVVLPLSGIHDVRVKVACGVGVG